MVKKPTLGQLTKSARRMGERRVKRLDNVIENPNVPQRVREWAKAQKKEILSAMQGTRQYAKDGHRYKKKESYIRKQLDRLTAAVKKSSTELRTSTRHFSLYTTTNEFSFKSTNRTELDLYTRRSQDFLPNSRKTLEQARS